MKILLLGASGQLGFDLCRLFQNNECFDVSPLTRTDLDLMHIARIPEVLHQYQFDILINCTAYNRVDDAQSHSQLAYAINTYAVEALAKYCAEVRAKFVHVSSDFVFNGEKTSPYTETDLVMPLSVYGTSKLLGELFAQQSHNDVLVIRTASLFGEVGSSGKGGNCVEAFVHKARREEELRVINDITMSPTSTADLAQAIISLLQQQAPSGIYHVVNDGVVTWYAFASEIMNQMRLSARMTPVSHAEFPMKALRPRYSVLDTAKTANVIGKMPTWQEALHRYLQQKRYI